MSDIKIVWRDLGGSIAIENADLLADESLQTAVIISLFTDRLANADDALPDDLGRRGWWADSFADNDRIGSRLWLLSREKVISEVLQRAREYALEALQWLLDDGIASAVNVIASSQENGFLILQIAIDRPSGQEQYQFNALWEAA